MSGRIPSPILLLLPLLLSLPAAAPAGAAEPLGVDGERRLLRDARAGDVVRDLGITVVAPPRGGFAWGEIRFLDGTWQELLVETDAAGRVYGSGWGDERAAVLAERRATMDDPAARGRVDAATPARKRRGSECRDTFRNLYGWRTPELYWQFNPRGIPANLERTEGGIEGVVGALARAQENITASVNVCDRSDRVDAVGGYVGLTHRMANVSAGGGCLGGDGLSVMMFGDLPSYSIAMTCVYGMRAGRAVEADIRINDEDSRWAVGRDACRGAELLLEAAMTHEFGHAYGLAHASTSRNPSLTMQPLIRACSAAPSTLGLGDMLGLERKY